MISQYLQEFSVNHHTETSMDQTQWIDSQESQNALIGGTYIPTHFYHFTDPTKRYFVRELDLLAICVSPSLNGSKMRSLWTDQK